MLAHVTYVQKFIMADSEDEYIPRHRRLSSRFAIELLSLSVDLNIVYSSHPTLCEQTISLLDVSRLQTVVCHVSYCIRLIA